MGGIQGLCNAMGGVIFPEKKHYEGERFNEGVGKAGQEYFVLKYICT